MNDLEFFRELAERLKTARQDLKFGTLSLDDLVSDSNEEWYCPICGRYYLHFKGCWLKKYNDFVEGSKG
jgi:hypothetical protein